MPANPDDSEWTDRSATDSIRERVTVSADFVLIVPDSVGERRHYRSASPETVRNRSSWTSRIRSIPSSAAAALITFRS